MTDYKPMTTDELRVRRNALIDNAGPLNRAILMNAADTSFAGTADDVTDEEVINAVRSVPTHY